MKLQIKHKGRVPYGGRWWYTDPNSGQEIYGTTWEMLINNVRRHREANGFPMGLEFEQEVENQLCLNHPAECEEYDSNIPRRTRLRLSDVVRGTQVMVAFYGAGKPLVDRTEAERRAQICLKCPYNSDFDKPCAVGVCRELREVVSSIINAQGTQYDGNLKSCNICGCFLRASIWLPLDIQCKGVTDEMKHHFAFTKQQYQCWKQC